MKTPAPARSTAIESAFATAANAPTSRNVEKAHSPSSLVKAVRSQDGTAIAFDRIGHGSPLILVDGGLCYRAIGPSTPLAKLLAPHFTVFTYDRRGRGDSGDTTPYAVEREVEDLEAVLNEAGGAAFVWGISSGAALALEATNRLAGVKKLALYEPPFIVDEGRSSTEDDWARIREAVAAGRRGDAVKLFLKSVGVPAFFATVLPVMPMWSKLKAIAHTLPYDGAIVQANQRGEPLPVDRWTSVTVPTLVVVGEKSPMWLHRSMRSLASTLPNAQLRTLARQTHNVSGKALAPVLHAFFGAVGAPFA
jgi:pimeloyl-ACP methyl ester carboxylesterase